MLKIKHNKSIKLDIPEFTCDKPLGPHLEKYDMLNQLNGFYFNCICGRPGSGKTSLLISLLTGKKKQKVFRKVFDNIVVVMPSTSRGSLKKNIFENHPEEKLFERLDLSTITSIHNTLQESSKEKEKTLLILDDVGSELKMLDIQQKLRQIIYNRRHLKCTIMILVQSYMSMPLEIRKMLNNIFLYKPSKMEFEKLFEELFETKKQLAYDILKMAYQDKHDWLLLNVVNQRLFKKFDEIIIHEDEN